MPARTCRAPLNSILILHSAVGPPLGKAKLLVGDEDVTVSGEAAAAAVDVAVIVPGQEEYDTALNFGRTTTADGVCLLVLVSYLLFCSRQENEQTAEV